MIEALIRGNPVLDNPKVYVSSLSRALRKPAAWHEMRNGRQLRLEGLLKGGEGKLTLTRLHT